MPQENLHRRRQRAMGESSFRAWYERGVISLQRNDFAEAINHFGAALRLNPNDSSALSNSGLALSAIGSFAEALFAFDRAIGEAPKMRKFTTTVRIP